MSWTKEKTEAHYIVTKKNTEVPLHYTCVKYILFLNLPALTCWLIPFVDNVVGHLRKLYYGN